MSPNKIYIEILFKLFCSVIGFQYHCALKYWLVIYIYTYMCIYLYMYYICVYTHTYMYIVNVVIVAIVQLLSHVWLFVTLWTATFQASLSFTILHYPLELAQTHVKHTKSFITLICGAQYSTHQHWTDPNP